MAGGKFASGWIVLWVLLISDLDETLNFKVLCWSWNKTFEAIGMELMYFACEDMNLGS